MKIVFSILTIFSTSAVSDYVLQQIDGIKGAVEAVEFDSNGNAYVAAFNSNGGSPQTELYKLNSAKEILWTTSINNLVFKITINSQNDIYLESSPGKGPSESILSIFREDTLTVEKIDDVYGFSIFLDEADNIIYSGIDGIKILRPKSTTPIFINNLEDYYITDIEIDSKGNVYLGVINFEQSNSSFAVVTNEEKQEQTPSATHYNLDPNYYFDYLTIDQNDDVWVFTSDLTSTSQILKFSNGELSQILLDEQYENHISKAVGNRVYVISVTHNYPTAPIYFLTLSGKVRYIQDLNEIPDYMFSTAQITADGDGNTYIGASFGSEKGPLVLVRSNEERARWINFPESINIQNMIVDGNNDLWIATNGQGIYSLDRRVTTAVKVEAPEGVDEDVNGLVNINKKTNEIFVLGLKGLYVVRNESV